MEIRKAESSRLGEPPGSRRRRDQAMMICGFTESRGEKNWVGPGEIESWLEIRSECRVVIAVGGNYFFCEPRPWTNEGVRECVKSKDENGQVVSSVCKRKPKPSDTQLE